MASATTGPRRRYASLVLTNLKHFGVTFSLLMAALVTFGVLIGADAHLFENRLAYQLELSLIHI